MYRNPKPPSEVISLLEGSMICRHWGFSEQMEMVELCWTCGAVCRACSPSMLKPPLQLFWLFPPTLAISPSICFVHLPGMTVENDLAAISARKKQRAEDRGEASQSHPTFLVGGVLSIKFPNIPEQWTGRYFGGSNRIILIILYNDCIYKYNVMHVVFDIQRDAMLPNKFFLTDIYSSFYTLHLCWPKKSFNNKHANGKPPFIDDCPSYNYWFSSGTFQQTSFDCCLVTVKNLRLSHEISQLVSVRWLPN